MRARVFSGARSAPLAGASRAPADIQTSPLEALKSYRPDGEEALFLDATGLGPDELKKQLATLRRRAASGANQGETQGAAWGVVDPKGAVKDPGRLFLDGAADYLGPEACKAGLDRTRLKSALALSSRQAGSQVPGEPRGAAKESVARASADARTDGPRARACADEPGSGAALAFPGWKALKPRSSYPFYFLYVSVSAQVNLKTRLGEAGYRAFRDKFRQVVQQGLAEADPLPWMETDASALFLVPPLAPCARTTIAACLRMLLGTPLLAYERLFLPFPVELTFAMHYGATEYAPPGSTGTIVSDAVNFSHHLGAKRAEAGRLTLSGEAAGALAECRLADLFVEAGCFEGRTIVHSRRFGSER